MQNEQVHFLICMVSLIVGPSPSTLSSTKKYVIYELSRVEIISIVTHHCKLNEGCYCKLVSGHTMDS